MKFTFLLVLTINSWILLFYYSDFFFKKKKKQKSISSYFCRNSSIVSNSADSKSLPILPNLIIAHLIPWLAYCSKPESKKMSSTCVWDPTLVFVAPLQNHSLHICKLCNNNCPTCFTALLKELYELLHVKVFHKLPFALKLTGIIILV